MVLNYHPPNEKIKRILLSNFTIVSGDPETEEIFPQPPIVAYRRDLNLRDILVHACDKSQPGPLAGTAPCAHTCDHISTDITLHGPKCSIVIRETFTCQTSDLVYYISCLRCRALYVGETGRTLKQRFGEHLRSIEKNQPGFTVAEHFNTNGHSLHGADVRGLKLSAGNKLRKRQGMRLIFQLVTSQLRGLNADSFRFP